jgi:hypothetical protein
MAGFTTQRLKWRFVFSKKSCGRFGEEINFFSSRESNQDTLVVQPVAKTLYLLSYLGK